MSQLLEVIITLVGNQRLRHLLQPIVPQLIYTTIGMPLLSSSDLYLASTQDA